MTNLNWADDDKANMRFHKWTQTVLCDMYALPSELYSAFFKDIMGCRPFYVRDLKISHAEAVERFKAGVARLFNKSYEQRAAELNAWAAEVRSKGKHPVYNREK